MTDDIEVITVVGYRSYARQPRGIVKLNGTAIDGWISWEVTNNSFYEADTFRVSFATSQLPQTSDANWFSQQKSISCEIFAGFPHDPENYSAVELTSLIYGQVDGIDFNPVGTEITLTGRDLTARFIDNRIATDYVNQTSSQIATQLASLQGLNPVVTKTKTAVGTYDDQEQVKIQANQSQWDLLARLAREEGFVVYVKGQDLHFEPDPTDLKNPYQITWKPPGTEDGSPHCNVIELKFSRALTIARGIGVTARSPNADTGKPVVQSYPSAAKQIQAGKAQAFGGAQNYFFTMAAGKTPQQVQAFAQEMYEAIVSHEMKVTLRLPADVPTTDSSGNPTGGLTTSTPIRISGTGTEFDQDYFARSITREMSIDEGFVMSIEAQNVNADTSPET